MKTSISPIAQAEKAFTDLEQANIDTDPLIAQKLSDARRASFTLICGLEQPDLNPHARPSSESEAEQYRILQEKGRKIIFNVTYDLQKKSDRSFIREHKRIFEVLAAGHKTPRQVEEALPDIDPDLIDRVMGTLQQTELLYAQEEKCDGNMVVVACLSTHGYIAFKDACPEEYERLFAQIKLED